MNLVLLICRTTCRAVLEVKRGDTYQATTFSNVPLHSDWYWAHVAYCYLVAFAVLSLLRRQHELASALRKRAKHIVGARSIFIQHGLPLDTSHSSLLEALKLPSLHKVQSTRSLCSGISAQCTNCSNDDAFSRRS